MRASLLFLAALPLAALAGEQGASAPTSAQSERCADQHRKFGVMKSDMKGDMKRAVAADGTITYIFTEKSPCTTASERSSSFATTEEVVVAIAIDRFIAIYGAERVEAERPFHAVVENGVWHVSGSLPPGHRGGTAEAEIDPKDGKILRVWRSR